MATQRRGITYVVSADEAKFIDGFRKVIAKSKQADRAVGNVGRSAQRGFDKGGRSAARMATSIQRTVLGLASVGTVATLTARAYADINVQLDKQVRFEKELTPLTGLGDNVNKLPALKRDVVGLSNVLNIATGEVNEFFFNLQSTTGGLNNNIVRDIRKEAIELTRVMGGELSTNTNALTKLWRTYGQELGTVNVAQNKLAFVAEKASIQMGELATLMPELIPVAKEFGLTFDEVGASIITATNVLGKNATTMTGVKNIILKMNDAERAGIKLTGDYVSMLEQINELDSKTKLKIFGAEAVAAAAAMSSHTADILKDLQDISEIDDSSDIVKLKLAQRQTDRQFRSAEARGQADRALENAALSSSLTPGITHRITRQKQAELAIKTAAPELAFLAKPIALADSAATFARNVIDDKLGLTAAEVDSRKAGRDAKFFQTVTRDRDGRIVSRGKKGQSLAQFVGGGVGNFLDEYRHQAFSINDGKSITGLQEVGALLQVKDLVSQKQFTDAGQRLAEFGPGSSGRTARENIGRAQGVAENNLKIEKDRQAQAAKQAAIQAPIDKERGLKAAIDANTAATLGMSQGLADAIGGAVAVAVAGINAQNIDQLRRARSEGERARTGTAFGDSPGTFEGGFGGRNAQSGF